MTNNTNQPQGTVRGRALHAMRIGIAGAVLIFVMGRPAAAIDIESVLWGFNGQVVANRFNMLSVLVSNYTPVEFDGTLVLETTTRGVARLGSGIEEPCFLSPGASRWIQFFVYVDEPSHTWRLSWGRGPDKQFTLPAVIAGKPGRVLLVESGNRFTRSTGLKQFDSDLFPTSVTGTSGLDAVLLDDVPRWADARRQAFLEWIKQGGTVHLLHGSDGQYPTFSSELAELNSPADHFTVGAGYVIRHPKSVSELGQGTVDLILRGSPEEIVKARGGGSFDGQAFQRPDTSQSAGNSYWARQLDMGIFAPLKEMRTVSHSWPLIYLLCLLYLALIFPGCYLISRGRRDYRLTYATLIGIIILFSFGFATVGRRGYGEAMAVNSVAIARPISDNAYDVTQWSEAFATRGGDYRIAHGGTGCVYSTCEHNERVNGIIRNGADAEFIVDIPPFSSRTFGNLMRVEDQPLGLQLEAWRTNETGNELEEFVVATGPQFPANPTMLGVLYRNKLYDLSQEGSPPGRLRLIPQSGQRVDRRIPTNEIFNYGMYGLRFGEDTTTTEQKYRDLADPMIVRSLDITNETEWSEFSLPNDRARVFVYAPMPETFYLKNESFAKQAGYVLYCVDFLRSPEG